tara:strand:+ start:14763 stop:15029 length:267 start_codon:yes stop_codon:yes gene_type:complete
MGKFIHPDIQKLMAKKKELSKDEQLAIDAHADAMWSIKGAYDSMKTFKHSAGDHLYMSWIMHLSKGLAAVSKEMKTRQYKDYYKEDEE